MLTFALYEVKRLVCCQRGSSGRPKMEEHNTVIFKRLLSEESTQSSLSVESCEYYQTEIFVQLPSTQQHRQGFLDVSETYQGSTEPGEMPSSGQLSKGARDKASMQPLRNLAVCIQAKRDARERRKMQVSNTGFLESWRQSQSISRKRLWAHMQGTLSYLKPWQHILHTIEGRFGVGVKAYFVFLRYVIYLNLLQCALICGFILGPTTYYGRSSINEMLSFEANDSLLDFIKGTGYLDRSPVFFGFYTRGSLNLPCLNTPLLYLAGILTILLLSLIMVVRRTVVGYKHTWMLGKRYSTNMSYKIFCGWDFNVQDSKAAALKCQFIGNDLKLSLYEQSFSQRHAQRKLGERVRLYLLRIILNVLVLTLLGGAFSLIYFATTAPQDENKQQGLYSLFQQYRGPFAITFVNLVLPHIFRKISSFEDYSVTTQVNTTLVRSIFLKLASLGIYLVFLLRNQPQQHQCSENQFGREMYKLSIFNFIATFCNAFFFNLPLKLVKEKCACLSRLVGDQHFLIPFHVLDLVYSQTVSWVGIYYCPLLPLIGTVILVATFYIKKFTILRCCVPDQQMFRASTSSVLFHFMLLLGLLMAVTTAGFSLYQQQVTLDYISTCGPFGNRETVFNVTEVCVDSLPSLAQTTVRYLASEAFALPLILAEIIILTSYVSRGRANQKAIERLKDMLVMNSSDKRFLVKQHATMLRRKKDTRKVCAAVTREDTPTAPGKTPSPSTHINWPK